MCFGRRALKESFSVGRARSVVVAVHFDTKGGNWLAYNCLGKPNDWQRLISKHLFFIPVADNLQRYSGIRQIGFCVLSTPTTPSGTAEGKSSSMNLKLPISVEHFNAKIQASCKQIWPERLPDACA